MNNNNKVLICLVRHGKTNQNLKKLIQGRKDFPLSNIGRGEALQAAKILKETDPNWDIIYSSPLSRAYETATIIASNIGYKKEVIKNEDFTERDFGISEGMPVCDEVFVKVLDDSWEGIETTQEIRKRMHDGVKKIIDNTNYKKIMIVSHSHAIKGFLSSIDNSIPMDYWIPNASLSYVEYENNEFKILEMGKRTDQ